VASAYAAAERLAPHAATVVVKLGALGALLTGPGGATAYAASVAVDVIDTTGAGDAFAAGFLPAWRSGRPAFDALEAGNLSAVRVVTRVGARP
jgi:sugar/nucleoside kinase (ribokinase family)